MVNNCDLHLTKYIMLVTDYIAKLAGDCMAKRKAGKADNNSVQKDDPQVSEGVSEEDVLTSDSEEIEVEKPNLINRFKALPTKKKRLYGAGVGLLALLVILWFVPSTKYAILNTVSEADASLKIVDTETELPVSGAQVTLGNGAVATSDAEGVAFFNDTEYGNTTATITKEAYEPTTVDVTISKDNIVLGPIGIVSNGVAVNVSVVDWLNNEAIADFAVVSENGETVFQSQDGVAQLNIPISADADSTYQVQADGYNQGSVTLDLTNILSAQVPTPEAVSLVREGNHTFLSNREGDVNFYSSNYDGTNVEKLVETGEDGNYFNYLSVPGSDTLYVVLLSSGNGTDLDQLAIVDLEAKSLKVVDEAPDEDIRFGFHTADEERVVYSVYYDGKQESGKISQKTKSYEFSSERLVTIAQSPTYVSVTYDPISNTVITYISNYLASPSRYELARTVLPDGDKQVLTNVNANGPYTDSTEPGSFFYYLNNNPSHKVGYYQMDFTGTFPGKYLGEDWPEFEEPDEVPDSEKGLASPEGTNRVWVETRDGKGRIILNETKNVVNPTGTLSVFSVIRWVDETTITVTGSDGTETADYIMDVESGNYKKITNTFRQSYSRHGF